MKSNDPDFRKNNEEQKGNGENGKTERWNQMEGN